MTPEQDPNWRVIGGPDAPHTYQGDIPASLAPLPGYGHLADYVRDLHIITGPNGMCRCGEDGITCSERLARVSREIQDALIAAGFGHNGPGWAATGPCAPSSARAGGSASAEGVMAPTPKL